MCAFEHARDAVDFACALQSVFYDHDWGTHVFDETYKDLIAPVVAALAEDGTAIINAQPDTAGDGWYDSSVWNGLRVRVGVHFGHGDIKLDPVSQGYDYYGTVVNTAARVEGVAHGGHFAYFGRRSTCFSSLAAPCRALEALQLLQSSCCSADCDARRLQQVRGSETLF